jgi:hypothetical protein
MADSKKVTLGRDYPFGKEVKVSILTLDDEEKILQQMDKGVSEKKATIALACGLNVEDAGKLVSPDATKIIEVLNDFQ